MKRSRWRWTLFATLGIAWGAWAQPPEQPPPQADIEALREQVRLLTDQLNGLEARYASDQASAEESAAEAAKAKEKAPKITLDGAGLRVQSADGAFEHRIRLRISHDFAWFKQDNELEDYIGDEQDGTGFRMARIRLQGKVWNDFTYVAEFDFAGETGADSPKFRDVYVQYNGIPYFGGNAFDLRIGHYKEPFSLDELNAISTGRQFMENPLLDVFVPERNAGIQISDAVLGEPKAERLTWTLGVFKETDDIPSSNDSDDDQGWQVTGRVTGLPIYAEGGRKLLHVGAAASLRNPDGAPLRYGVRPENRLALFRYVDTDRLPAGFRLRDARADDIHLYGLELAGVFEGFSFQSEYIRSEVDTTLSGDLSFDGWYAQAGYIFTGEHRPYRNDSGRFDAPKPLRPFNWRGEDRGWGAWELLARYGEVDLTDGFVRGGEHEALTFGLNWYVNDNVRWFVNWTRNDIEHDLYDGKFDVLATRIQLEF
jgi:phosphate-selective porin OprO/OprP